MDVKRRHFLKVSLGAAALISIPKIALASPSSARIIKFNNLHTGERLQSCYFDGQTFVKSELSKIDHICRDFRRNEIHPMDKRLLTQLSQIQRVLNTDAEIQIISGYRSPATNESLRAHGHKGVARKSLHMQGRAIDIRIAGVDIAKVHDAALSIKAGGVGYYPGSQFVHIDTGAVRSWHG
ncbi:hypothetical protein A9264_07440 [Vibrio sp. UCD-FRSSP16_10]|uniref:YcbK family protein n=1 Tax=unclassified Vibrio TaxID=2614977 RepID=UPI0007FC3CC6|nr:MULTISPECIES: YcbK family protein [unclassified Vibrio]OBT13499.1 hypothetical protein A9264_07440 [Vibrio sp. UCD-FRSSP16_10]OBT18020.1 hypothetical protein A9260_01430 [Vibrio sp. UCD-FRSSP16_30]